MPRMVETEARRPHLSCADALAKTASEFIEAIVRKRRILFAGFVVRMGEERLLQRVMFGKLVGGKGYSGGQEKDWRAHLKEDMSVFGMKFERWPVAKGCSEGQHMVSTSRGGSRVVRAEMALDGETQRCRATRKGCGSAIHRRHL